jgi:hypothetical protein
MLQCRNWLKISQDSSDLNLSKNRTKDFDNSKNKNGSIVSNWNYPVKPTATTSQDDDDDTAPEITPSQIAPQPNSEKDCNAQSNLASKPMPPSGLEILQLLLAKPNVDAILWNQCLDSSEFTIPQAGLFTKDLQPRSIVECMTRLRSQYLP